MVNLPALFTSLVATLARVSKIFETSDSSISGWCTAWLRMLGWLLDTCSSYRRTGRSLVRKNRRSWLAGPAFSVERLGAPRGQESAVEDPLTDVLGFSAAPRPHKFIRTSFALYLT